VVLRNLKEAFGKAGLISELAKLVLKSAPAKDAKLEDIEVLMTNTYAKRILESSGSNYNWPD
jgi:hypothetical protein